MKFVRVERGGRQYVGYLRDQTVTVFDSGQPLSGQGLTNVLWSLIDDDLEEPLYSQSKREFSADSVRFLPPFPTVPSFRDFYAFEAHVVNARRLRGQEGAPEQWYKAPAFYFSNPGPFYGPEDTVPCPALTRELDYELEIGIVIGKDGRDVAEEKALHHVAGFTILNDWSMRDVQREEVKVGLGPHKAKDFATSIGPWLVTLEELQDRFADGRWDLAMTAFVNGEETSRGNFADIHFPVAALVAHASRNAPIRRGDLLGSGTVGTGCLLEQQPNRPFLKTGDIVELRVELLGALRNRVG